MGATFAQREDLAQSIADAALSTLGLPDDLASEIREVLIDALLAHPEAELLLRRCIADPQVARSDEVARVADSMPAGGAPSKDAASQEDEAG